jgi:hypothetical protein
MKQIKTANNANAEKDPKEKTSWRLYEIELQHKAKRDRKSVSNNKVNSANFLNNRLGKIKENYSTEKNNSFNALGKAGSNIITNMSNINKIPPHLKVSQNQNQEKVHLKMPSSINGSSFGKLSTNYTPKNNITFNFKEAINNKQNIINYESVENVTKTNVVSTVEKGNEEEKSNMLLSIDNESILSHLNFIEIWLDTDLAIENKSLFSTILNKFLKEFGLDLAGKNFEVFSSANINRIYIKILKLSLIIVVVAKFVLAEFTSYESSIKFQLKKIFLTISELFGVLFEIYVFDLLKKEVIDKKFGLLEKLRKLIKTPYSNLLKLKSKNQSNLNEVLFQISKTIENNLINQIKNFSK